MEAETGVVHVQDEDKDHKPRTQADWMWRERWQGPYLKAELRTGLDFSSVMGVDAAKGVSRGKGKSNWWCRRLS